MKMRVRSVLAAAAAAASMLAVVPLTAASAATVHVLTIVKVGGPNVKVGATVAAGLKTGTKATFFSPGTTTGVTCASAATSNTVTANPVKPGIAGESLTTQKFGKCTTNIPGATSVMSVKALNLPYKVTISDATGFPVKVSNLSTKITLGTVIGTVTCTYKAATLKGKASNTGSTEKFTNQPFTLSSGSSACPSSGNFSATFGPEKDISVTGSPAVFVN
jgi:hypothetical protein